MLASEQSVMATLFFVGIFWHMIRGSSTSTSPWKVSLLIQKFHSHSASSHISITKCSHQFWLRGYTQYRQEVPCSLAREYQHLQSHWGSQHSAHGTSSRTRSCACVCFLRWQTIFLRSLFQHSCLLFVHFNSSQVNEMACRVDCNARSMGSGTACPIFMCAKT